MKHHSLAILAATALVMTSCSSDEPPMTQQEGTTTFTLSLPAPVSSRAYGDGDLIESEVSLHYAIFAKPDHGSALGTYITDSIVAKRFSANQTGSTPDTYSTTLSITFALGKNYNVVFWAANDNQSAYTFDPHTAEVTIDYDKMSSNADNLDAYFGSASVTSGDATGSVTLRRPFAQLNLATSDINEPTVVAAFGTDLTSDLTIKSGNLNTQVNLFTGKTSVPTTKDTYFAPTTITPYDMSIGGVTYKWMSMDYVLADVDKTTIDCTWNIAHNNIKVNTIEVPNTPIQRNYRTNVFGALLSYATEFNVTIDPEFFLCPYLIPLPDWDGQPTTATNFAKLVNVTNKTISIYSAGDLAFLAQIVNSDATVTVDGVTFDNGASLKDYTVNLMANINLRGGIWTPIGYKAGWFGGSGQHANAWEGQFNGNNHSIYNMNVENALQSGLFGVIAGNGSVKNVILRRPIISKCKTQDDSAVGFIAGSIYRGGSIDSCSVMCGEINNPASKSKGSQSGGIVGWAENFSITNCTVFKTSIKSNAQVGGIVGHTDSGYTSSTPSIISNNVVDGCNLVAQIDSAGGIVAQSNNGTVENNTVENTTIFAFFRVGPIGGLWNNTNQTNLNTITNVTVNGSLWTPNN